MEALYVKPECRGKGVGKKLFAALFKEAKKRRIKEVELSCWSSNAAAMKLYGKMGFVEARKAMKKFL